MQKLKGFVCKKSIELTGERVLQEYINSGAHSIIASSAISFVHFSVYIGAHIFGLVYHFSFLISPDVCTVHLRLLLGPYFESPSHIAFVFLGSLAVLRLGISRMDFFCSS